MPTRHRPEGYDIIAAGRKLRFSREQDCPRSGQRVGKWKTLCRPYGPRNVGLTGSTNRTLLSYGAWEGLRTVPLQDERVAWPILPYYLVYYLIPRYYLI